VPFDAMRGSVHRHGYDPRVELPAGMPFCLLPFASVSGHWMFAVSDFTANVLVETISFRLNQPGIRDRVTGTFVMDGREDQGTGVACPPQA
jgi:phenylacetate-CoA ligase